MSCPVLNTREVRKCGLCQHPITMTEDSATRRLYACDCGAVEVITKGKSWWYHGCVRPDGKRRDGDGRISENGNYGWWLNTK